MARRPGREGLVPEDRTWPSPRTGQSYRFDGCERDGSGIRLLLSKEADGDTAAGEVVLSVLSAGRLQEALAELLNTMKAAADRELPAEFDGFDLSKVADLPVFEPRHWLTGTGTIIERGLEAFAHLGPIVEAPVLHRAVGNLGQFRTRVTSKLRAMTGSGDALLFAHAPGSRRKGQTGPDRFAMSPVTYRAARNLFGLSG